MGPNGKVVRLTAGEYEASVASSGAMLATLTKSGRNIVVPVDVDHDLPVAYQGKSLIPWPNRITGGTYTFAGRTLQVPINESATSAALHGLGCWSDWAIVSRSEDAVTFATDVLPSYGYPFALHVTCTYKVSAETGLSVHISAQNTGANSAPYGVSSHPYLANGDGIDECELTVPASLMLQVDERLAPDHLDPVEDAGTDFRNGRKIGTQEVDNAFTGLPEGEWEVRLSRVGAGTVVMTASDPWVQVYTGELVGRRGVAIEPMTCAPDAFNSGDGLIVLAPGQSHEFGWTLRLDE